MTIILLLILASLGVAALFLGAFIWAVSSGQYEDTCTPSMRMLSDDTPSAPRAAKLNPNITQPKSP